MESANMPTVTTIGGWAVVLAVASSFYWVNNQRKNKNRRALDTKQSGKAAAEVKKEVKNKKRKDGGQSSGDQAVKSTSKGQKMTPTQTKPVEEEKATTTARESNDVDDDEINNREFARAMASAKAGTITTSKAQASTKPKSVKQSKAHDKPIVEANSAPSSTTGGDADDDQSPINSPELGATDVAAPASGDVSDMLEKPADSPQVLKITAPTKPAVAKPNKPTATAEPAETKKQRQNRKKAEEKKAAREAEEKERQTLLEKQRRTAREAEGRAAKDGSAFMAAQAQATTKSAWTAPPETNGSKEAAPAKPVELLDTLEPTNGKVTTKPAEVVYSESEEAGSRLAKEYANMTEDEQMRKVQEDSAAWETVKTKKGKKASSKDGKKSAEEKQSSASDQSDFGVPPVTAPTVPGKKWGMTVVHVDNNNNVVEQETEVQDSEWEVA